MVRQCQINVYILNERAPATWSTTVARIEQHSTVLSVCCLWHIFGVMGGATEAPEEQASPPLYSFYYHSLVTRHNNAGYFISINFSSVDIHLSICKLWRLTLLIFMGCSWACAVCVCVFVTTHCSVSGRPVRSADKNSGCGSRSREICRAFAGSPPYSVLG